MQRETRVVTYTLIRENSIKPTTTVPTREDWGKTVEEWVEAGIYGQQSKVVATHL